ncbi:MAG: uracil-DNA glycosylase family protein [Candidatus Micrarchaeaceae archaeon]
MQHDAGILIYKIEGTTPLFLFLKRREGWLDITKGHIEKGENKPKAALREAKEESGLDVSYSIDPDFSCTIYYNVNSMGEEERKELTVFIAKASGREQVKVSKEHSGYIWLSYTAAMERIKEGWQRELLPCAHEYISRKAIMERLNSEYSRLPSKFSEWNLSKTFVPGEGPLNAKVMFVGQAPGAQEDAKKRPFIGRSGQLLDRLIRSSGINRENAYITSVVQFFPPANRMPTDKEISACRNFLYRQIEIVKPKIIVLLGAVAAKEVLGVKGISAVHGKAIKKDGILYLLTLHPAAAVRIKSNMPKIEADFRNLGNLIKEIGA